MILTVIQSLTIELSTKGFICLTRLSNYIEILSEKYLSFMKKYQNNLLFSLKFVTHFDLQDNIVLSYQVLYLQNQLVSFECQTSMTKPYKQLKRMNSTVMSLTDETMT